MEKIEIKENPLGLQVFVNGVPDLTSIPKKKRTCFSMLWLWR